jgi:alpha-L-rhamnosidase
MGLISPHDWKAQWIGFSAGWAGRALYFRHDFPLKKTVSQARAYIAGLGYYELHLNGQRVGDRVLDPGLTDYSKRILYSTYDVSSLVKTNQNTVGVIVGNGWYGIPKLLMQLEVTYADGSKAQFYTMGGHLGLRWMVTSGPILTHSVYDGETYDARLEKPAWDQPETKLTNPFGRTEEWQTAFMVEPPGGRLVSQTINPIKIVDIIRPQSVKEPKPGVFVLDTGQNLAGWAELRVSGERGTRVSLKFAENLASDGTVNQENLRGAAATDLYILKGNGPETWEPRFTYHGFRYLQLEGFPGRLAPENIAIKVVRSSVEPNGKLETSNALINAIQKMVWWTEASNLHSIPTDCPQRDERMGWLNDLTVRTEEAIYNFNLSRFFSKFLDDIRDTQGEDGSITDTAPHRWGARPADPVSASYLLLAWFLYQHYGDTRAMENNFDGFKAWTDFLARKTENGIVTYGYYGDWAPPSAFTIEGSLGTSAVSKDTPVEMMSTGYLYYCSSLLTRMAGILGKEKDRQKYADLAKRTAEAFNRKFWKAESGGYGANNQAANSFALFLGLVPESRVPRVVENLAHDVEAHGGHLTTGNLCTKYVLEALTAHGKADLAYAIATQESYPSWGFMLAHGATTVWERWEHLTGGQMNSHNHPMMGSVSAWFYKYLAGINVDPQFPGFKGIIIRPYPVQGLTWVQSEYTSMYGVIRSSWKKETNTFQLNVAIPTNSTATVYIPAQNVNQVTEGGMPVTKALGVHWLRDEPGRVVLEIGSGNYEFKAQP